MKRVLIVLDDDVHADISRVKGTLTWEDFVVLGSKSIDQIRTGQFIPKVQKK